APTVRDNRKSDPKRLSQLFRGELDWIVMRAVEKDGNGAYESASAFAADVQRYLSDEPVLACPPSVGYRLGKFVRRNKGPVLAAGIFVLLLAAGIVGTPTGLIQAITERNEKEAALRRGEENGEQKKKGVGGGGEGRAQKREEGRRTGEGEGGGGRGRPAGCEGERSEGGESAEGVASLQDVDARRGRGTAGDAGAVDRSASGVLEQGAGRACGPRRRQCRRSGGPPEPGRRFV